MQNEASVPKAAPQVFDLSSCCAPSVADGAFSRIAPSTDTSTVTSTVSSPCGKHHQVADAANFQPQEEQPPPVSDELSPSAEGVKEFIRIGESTGVRDLTGVRESTGESTAGAAVRETHYVLVIHGTWDAPPEDGQPTWYHPAPDGEVNFCSKLASLLGRGPLTRHAVWRQVAAGGDGGGALLPDGVRYPFFWDGANNHASRVEAANQLVRVVDGIAQTDPTARIHFIAHSHGGNVVLKTVELYLAQLERRPLASFHARIQRDFAAAFQKSCVHIRKWRQMPAGAWCWRLHPFHIVWRTYSGGPAGSGTDRYPWAYYRWADALLRLGPRRERLFRAQRQVTSPISNPLGALVFLGTPFLVKHWQQYGVALLLLSTLAYLALAYAALVAYIMLVRLVFVQSWRGSLTVSHGLGVELNVAAVIEAVVGLSVLMQLLRNTVFHSGNLYHNPRLGWSSAMTALVVHAGKLDEASLALSAEPLVKTRVIPHLRRMLQRDGLFRLPPWPASLRRPADVAHYMLNLWLCLLWNALFFLPMAAWALLVACLVPLFSEQLRRLVVSMGYGLQPGELDYANVYVDEHLDLPLGSHTVEHVNVQRYLAEAKVNTARGVLMDGFVDDTATFSDSRIGSQSLRRECSLVRDFLRKVPIPEEDEEAEDSDASRDRAIKEEEEEDSIAEGRDEAIGGRGGREGGGGGEAPAAGGGGSHGSFVAPARSRALGGGVSANRAELSAAALGEEEAWSAGDGGGVGVARSHALQGRLTRRRGPRHRQPGAAAEAEGEYNPYEFLWNETVLDQMAEASPTYQALKEQVNWIDHNPRLTRRAFERELKQVCVMLEERVKEITGRVDLNHGSYFRDPRILRIIAHYLETREVAAEARELEDGRQHEVCIAVEPELDRRWWWSSRSSRWSMNHS
eukprot:jgi/Mesen1/2328/ME000155S01420